MPRGNRQRPTSTPRQGNWHIIEPGDETDEEQYMRPRRDLTFQVFLPRNPERPSLSSEGCSSSKTFWDSVRKYKNEAARSPWSAPWRIMDLKRKPISPAVRSSHLELPAEPAGPPQPPQAPPQPPQPPQAPQPPQPPQELELQVQSRIVVLKPYCSRNNPPRRNVDLQSWTVVVNKKKPKKKDNKLEPGTSGVSGSAQKATSSRNSDPPKSSGGSRPNVKSRKPSVASGASGTPRGPNATASRSSAASGTPKGLGDKKETSKAVGSSGVSVAVGNSGARKSANAPKTAENIKSAKNVKTAKTVKTGKTEKAGECDSLEVSGTPKTVKDPGSPSASGASGMSKGTRSPGVLKSAVSLETSAVLEASESAGTSNRSEAFDSSTCKKNKKKATRKNSGSNYRQYGHRPKKEKFHKNKIVVVDEQGRVKKQLTKTPK